MHFAAAWVAMGLITVVPAAAEPVLRNVEGLLAQPECRENVALCSGWSDIACNRFQMSWTTCRTGQHERHG